MSFNSVLMQVRPEIDESLNEVDNVLKKNKPPSTF